MASDTKDMKEQIDAILEFWFGPDPGEKRDAWFERSDAFDEEIRTKFGAVQAQAAAGECDGWAETPRGALALVLLLDQFSRNLFRGDARAFASDSKALGIADAAIQKGWDREFPEIMRIFFYLPHEHCEDLEVQRRCVELFTGTEWGTEYAEAHFKLIERFGRFPHRNAVLGRENTPDEEAYLSQPREGFEAG